MSMRRIEDLRNLYFQHTPTLKRQELQILHERHCNRNRIHKEINRCLRALHSFSVYPLNDKESKARIKAVENLKFLRKSIFT